MPSQDGKTALDFARENDHDDVVRALEEQSPEKVKGADTATPGRSYFRE